MRIIRILVAASSACCMTLMTCQLDAQDGGIIRAVESFDQQQPDMVKHAAPTADHIGNQSGVAHADGSTDSLMFNALAPIVTPDQAQPQKSSAMLAPLANSGGDAIANDESLEDSNVQQATAQWALNPMSPQGAHAQNHAATNARRSTASRHDEPRRRQLTDWVRFARIIDP